MSGNALLGQVVLVTGGTRGIGRAVALGAAREGASVVVCARHHGEDAAVLLDAVEVSGGRALVVRADVASEADVAALFEAARAAFGRIDAVVNNAAVSHDALLVSLPTERWDEVIAINLTGSFLVARQAVRVFLEQGSGGRIVTVGSLAQEGAPSNACYAASKGGLVGLTQAIAAEHRGRGIAANLVVAGYVETELTRGLPGPSRSALIEACPARRPATPEEIAAVAIFLASPRSAGLSGQILRAAGGLTAIPS